MTVLALAFNLLVAALGLLGLGAPERCSWRRPSLARRARSAARGPVFVRAWAGFAFAFGIVLSYAIAF